MLWLPASARLARACLSLAVVGWPFAAVASPRYAISAELGPEFDSNAQRQASDVDAPVASGLMRVVLDGQLRLELGRHRLAVGYGGGARVFLTEEARMADEAVQHAKLSWALGLSRGASVALLGSYYDAFQRESTQDFRTGSALFRLALGRGATALSLLSGYQGLHFKPFDDYSFHGLTGGASLIHEVRKDEFASWRLSFGYNAALRVFNGGVLDEERLPTGQSGPGDPCSPEEGGERGCLAHQALAQSFHLGAHYVGEALADLWYEAEINHSNSFGETYTRHAVGAKFTSLLFWGVFFTAKGVLRFARFRDPFLVAEIIQSRFVDIDDENRSSLLLQLCKDVTRRWTAIARYSLHTNESSGGASDLKPAGFQRHLVFVGMRLRYGNDV